MREADGLDSESGPIRETLTPEAFQTAKAEAAAGEDDALPDRLVAYHRESALAPAAQFGLYQAYRAELLEVALGGPADPAGAPESAKRRESLRQICRAIDDLERAAVEAVVGRVEQRTDERETENGHSPAGTDEPPVELAALATEVGGTVDRAQREATNRTAFTSTPQPNTDG